VLYEKVYCARGRMDNLIKDMKLYTRSDRTHATAGRPIRSACFLHHGGLLATARTQERCAETLSLAHSDSKTIRCTFLKIAVRIEELKTRIKMALPSAYPHVQALIALATSIAARAP
jgi:Transposase DDE domain group 1